jgi:hypothetical protein
MRSPSPLLVAGAPLGRDSTEDRGSIRKGSPYGQPPTRGVHEHIDAMKAFVETTGGAPVQITSHPIGFGSGEWTCVVGEFEGGGRMVTVAKWRDGAIAEEYIWM